jgi:hypothetical protein
MKSEKLSHSSFQTFCSFKNHLESEIEEPITTREFMNQRIVYDLNMRLKVTYLDSIICC